MVQWIVSQVGARQHYAVPRGFENVGWLKRFYTDLWCPAPLRPLLAHGNAPLRAFAARFNGELARNKVISTNLRAMLNAFRHSWHGELTIEQVHLEYLRVGDAFDGFVANHIQKSGDLNPATDAFFGFNTTSLRTIRMCHERGVSTVLDQIDPGKVEEDLVIAESQKWPGWQKLPGRVPQVYWDHMAEEWQAADRIMVNSNWTRDALVQQGVPQSKIVVLAIAYEPFAGPLPLPRTDDHPLTVLWLGAVVLRKGIQYLMDAARLLQHTRFRFIIAGPIGISSAALATAPRNMQFVGRVTRNQTERFYREADVFILPTLSDGFAITQLEAMNRGLPVIATSRCGEVVTDGRDGFIVPAGDSAALAEALLKLDRDRVLLSHMAHNAFLRATQFLLPLQARQISAVVEAMRRGTSSPPEPIPATPSGVLAGAHSRNLQVAVVQDGARLHYAAPLVLQRAGVLHLMFSEWFLKRGMKAELLSRIIRPLGTRRFRGLIERRCDELSPDKVRTNPRLLWRVRSDRPYQPTDEAFYRFASAEVGQWVLRRGIGDANLIFGFIRNIDPGLCEECRARGIVTVGDQIIAPAAVEGEEFRLQLQRYPGWEPTAMTPDFGIVVDVERRTWAALDRISCASEYVRQGLVKCGVRDEKITLIPYPLDAAHYPVADRRGRTGKITVGFVGAVGLRKGSPYFFEVARRLASDKLRFVMVGPSLLTPSAAANAAGAVDFIGRVQRSEVAGWLNRFDIYFFPSTCEGSAQSVTEAMACGLPVVVSSNSGSVVREGIDGFIRSYDDIDGMAACVQRLADDESLRLEMGRQARLNAESLSLARYQSELVALMTAALPK